MEQRSEQLGELAGPLPFPPPARCPQNHTHPTAPHPDAQAELISGACHPAQHKKVAGAANRHLSNVVGAAAGQGGGGLLVVCPSRKGVGAQPEWCPGDAGPGGWAGKAEHGGELIAALLERRHMR